MERVRGTTEKTHSKQLKRTLLEKVDTDYPNAQRFRMLYKIESMA